MALLDIHNLSIHARGVPIVQGLNLQMDDGEIVCLVGESGSGKSVTALSIARLLPEPPIEFAQGEIRIQGQNVLSMSKREIRKVRGSLVNYIFQEPGAALNPVYTIGSQIKESLAMKSASLANNAEVVKRLASVGIADPESRANQYPHEFSGGMLQRVMIAMALATQPRLLVADEPTTALDVTLQAQILELLQELRFKRNLAILMITHNLGIVEEFADRVAVMYAGQIVETGPTAAIFSNPRHPYTRALIDSSPTLHGESERMVDIPGSPPSPGSWPSGCRFHPRCSIAKQSCQSTVPGLVERAPGHSGRCPHMV
jgi:peptide/nickel transport system ATP-binding protein